MQIYRTSLYLVRITLDIIILILSILLSALITYKISLHIAFELNARHILLIFTLVVTWYFSAKVIGLYDEFRSRDFISELILVIKQSLPQQPGQIYFLLQG